MSQLPTRARNFRLSDRSVADLEWLAARLGRTQTDVIQTALLHLRVTTERDERVYFARPEQPDDESGK